MHRYLLACGLTILTATTTLAQGKDRSGWLNDFNTAKAEARKSGKPLMVVFSCEPCPDTGSFDTHVRYLDEVIAPVADKFVRVRLVRITGVDLRLFEFDYDVSWFAFFLNADETVYGRYGGRDASSAASRLSLPGLRFAMEQSLELHKNPPKPVVRSEKPLLAESMLRKGKGGCMHCHNVNEGLRADLKAKGKWERDLVWAYPLPENVGVTLDVDRGVAVKSIVANSAAARAGLKTGDMLKTLNNLPVASFADVSYALHKGPKSGDIAVSYLRDGKALDGKLTVAEGWRRTNLSWRSSLIDLMPSNHFSGEDLKPDEKKALGLSEKRLAFRQDKFVHSSLKGSGVLKDDVLVGIDGKDLDGDFGTFTAYLKTNYLAGDQVSLRLIRDGKMVEIKTTLK